MHRRIKITAAAICLCLLALSLTALAVFSTPVQTGPILPSASQAPSLYEMEKDSTFLVSLHNGYVAVYLPETPDYPLEMTDIRANSLRLADQEMLRQGVLLQGLETLSHFLEDFAP